MKGKLIVLNEVDATTLGHILNRVTGRSCCNVSDKIRMFFQNGSVSRTSPPTPRNFHGDKSFRHIRLLPPVKNYSGVMTVNRQGGVPKSIMFE